MGAEQSAPQTVISSLAVCDELVYVGTACGRIMAYPLGTAWPPTTPLVQHKVPSGRPVTQLQVLPEVGLLLRACGGQVSAHALDSLRVVSDLHPSRATRFHSDGGRPVAGLCVCAGQSLLWRYELGAPPTLLWSRMLRHPTLAVHLDPVHLVVATARACLVLSAASGATLAECALPSLDGVDNAQCRAQLPPVEWAAARFVPSTEPGALQVGTASPKVAAALQPGSSERSHTGRGAEAARRPPPPAWCA